jgi:FtsX-like permease family
VLPVQRPAEIANFQSMGTAPVILAGALVLGALSSLLLTLMSSVRRRRRDLALLKILGFTRRQLSATVAWQSTAAITAGTIVGVPVGIALGRRLWDLFARQISVVPEPTVPALTVVLIVIGALVIANLVALLPGRLAGRTPAAALLRAELSRHPHAHRDQPSSAVGKRERARTQRPRARRWPMARRPARPPGFHKRARRARSGRARPPPLPG